MDVSKVIEAKSDQLNADDLVAGPITVRVRDVKVTGTEQPLSVYYDGDNNKPWKPCKTAARCLASVWGVDAGGWIGKRLTLYRDDSVTWGGVAVGGIRVSHMEGLTKPVKLMLAKTRGKKGEVVVQPLKVQEKKEEPAPENAVDATAIHEEARGIARQGRDAFMAWWKSAEPEQKHAANEIMDELKKLMADAE